MRTIQENEGEEEICVAFSSGAAAWEASSSLEGLEKEKFVKCKMYVEAVDEGQIACHFYLVLETGKQAVVTEVSKGVVTWLKNPRSLEERNSLAKLLFQADCKENTSLQDVKKFQEALVLPPGPLLRARSLAMPRCEVPALASNT